MKTQLRHPGALTPVLVTLACTLGISTADDLALLCDEFDNATSLPSWQRLHTVEGWNADQVEQIDIDTSVGGHMRVVPYASSWFRNLKGVLVFKEVTGDFVATAKLTLTNRNGSNQGDPVARPGGTFSLAGILAHGPRDITPDTWMANTENYIFLAFGRAGSFGVNPDDGVRHQCEIKTTVNSASDLYFTQTGIPGAAEPRRNEVLLQMIRVGDTAVVLRRHPGGPWIVENRYPNGSQSFPQWGGTLQVGITTYTDWETCQVFNSNGAAGAFAHNSTVLDAPGNAFGTSYSPNPDLIADVDYFRYERPDPGVTVEALDALQTAYDPDTGVSDATGASLPEGGIGLLLGDNANSPLRAFRASAFGSANLADPLTDLQADFDGDGKSNLLEYLFGTPAEIADPVSISSSTTDGSDASISFPLNVNSSAVTAIAQMSSDLGTDSWSTLATRPAGSGSWTPEGAAEVVEEGGEVTITPPGSSPAPARQFFRLVVSAE